MSNFVPHETKRDLPRNPPCITKSLKTMVLRKNRPFKSYKRHGFIPEDKIRLDNFRKGCQEAKLSYLPNIGNKLPNIGNKLNDPITSQKSCWKIINNVVNNCKSPKIPPLLINNLFILICREKAKLFTDFFSQQCKPNINESFSPTSVT